MLEARELRKEYKGHVGLHGLNLSVGPGEIYCLLGANGAGKSTTINLFLGFIRPTSGQAFIDGMDVTEHAARSKERVAYIPENLMLYPQLTGLENLDYFAGLAGIRLTKDRGRGLLLEAGLQESFIGRRVAAYSKGMRQKVGIALTIARDAKILLLDEPTSGLDPKASNEFSDLLLRMKERGMATLMATHDLFRARATGTHIGIMREGTLTTSFRASEVSHAELEATYLRCMENDSEKQ